MTASALQEGDEIKIVFTGPMGAGKTTAIAAISDLPPVSTDVDNADRLTFDKETTTVALDFGEIALDGGQRVKLYGTPGQERFSFMWQILGEGALGVVLLLDATQPTMLADLDVYLTKFESFARASQIVVGVGRTEAPDATSLDLVVKRLHLLDLNLPVFGVDVRQRGDVLLLIETLLTLIESTSLDGPAYD
ncbi:ATP/GTP-binding protein [Stenotrophomonas sp.]|uniref:GTP-binding protein n=1 Tax=Stenotrophomonas sp. TaxID=69392 RepID=UPI00374DDDCB